MRDVERLALNLSLVDEMYERYRVDPSSVDPSWWVQEEPANMGAAQFVLPRIQQAIGRGVRAITRPESASAATGSARAHVLEQRELLDRAFGGGGASSEVVAGSAAEVE